MASVYHIFSVCQGEIQISVYRSDRSNKKALCHSEPVLQSAANLLMKMIAGGNHTLIKCGLVRNDSSIERTINYNFTQKIPGAA
jgi:hypothetical protein